MPSQVILKENGLSILMCKDHSLYDLCMKYFYLPKNLYYSPHYESWHEMFATCSVEPNVMRSAVSSSYNTSVAKVNVIGGYQDLSTFIILGRAKVDKIFHSDCTMLHVHLHVNCPEIAQILASREGKETE